MIGEKVREIAVKARMASAVVAGASTEKKNNALNAIAEALEKNVEKILAANEKDVIAARKKGLSDALADRLLLNEKRIKAMAEETRKVASLKDPVGEAIVEWTLENGLRIKKVRVPLGVIALIYESRPNVTVDASVLCLKAGNAVVLKGGSDAINSNKAIVEVISGAIEKAGLPKEAISFIPFIERESVNALLKLHGVVDLIIPRGSGSLIKMVVENSSVPVIETGEGNCHVFVDESADLEKAKKIVVNAKVQRPGVCNAVEKLLVHERIAEKFLPSMVAELRKHGVEVRGDEMAVKIVRGIVPATDADWPKEYLDLVIAIKVVGSVDEAIAHINKFNTKHSDAIVSGGRENISRFLNEVDAACVYANASTRFTDGAQFGFGSEIGVSTQKMHARGPMGLRELTSYKYVVEGSGQIRE
ncbi:MAG: glutamate-5-semialdehyde dehydrogenase [Candidatus Diapherotrites archaeon]